MTWVTYALLCAFFLATSDVFTKKALRDVNEYTVCFGRILWAIPCVALALPFSTIPPVDSTFWFSFILLIPIEITAVILYTRAIKLSPLSITTPFLGLTPLFLIVTAYLLLGEKPDASGMCGIVLVALGAYSLNIRQSKVGFLGPLKAIAHERGSLLMVITAVLYSITSVLGKICTQHSSPVFFSMIYVITLPVFLFPFVYGKTSQKHIVPSCTNPFLIVAGLFYGGMVICHLSGIVLVEVPYMLSVKRTSLLFSILYGRFLFHETGFTERLAGGVLMLAGIVLITIV